MNTILLALALLQDAGKVEALEKRVAELEAKVERLDRALKAFVQGQAPVQNAIQRALQQAKSASCANNLRQLWTLQYTYSSHFGGRAKKMPEAIGPDFWLALSKTEPPLVEESKFEIYVCPLKGEEARAGYTGYRGPSKKVSELKAEDVVGCCQHPDGSVNALYKSGDVRTLGPDDSAAKAAVEGTQGPPKK